MNEPVDVLIIVAGASGAAVAWSLAGTTMHILCLEQGGAKRAWFLRGKGRGSRQPPKSRWRRRQRGSPNR
jgi:choline dehydrogenase-like flavoprotein